MPGLAKPAKSLWKRGQRYFERHILKWSHPALHRFLELEAVDFAYPCVTGGEKTGKYRTAHWIADLQYAHYPEFLDPQVLRDQERYLSAIARSASTVVVSSQFGASDCSRLFPSSRNRLYIMPFRVQLAQDLLPKESVQATRRYNLPGRFILISNQFWQNKNHRVVFEAVSKLKEQRLRINLVCTGHVYDHRLPKYSDTVHAMIHELGIADRVFLLGAIPRMQQVDLMRRAIAVVQPSLFEGWNTAIEEARAIGRRVIASNIPVHQEQSWERMSLFNPQDLDALAFQIEQIWSSDESGDVDLTREAAALNAYACEVENFAHRFLLLAENKA